MLRQAKAMEKRERGSELPWRSGGGSKWESDCKAMESFRERNKEFYREKVRECVCDRVGKRNVGMRERASEPLASKSISFPTRYQWEWE